MAVELTLKLREYSAGTELPLVDDRFVRNTFAKTYRAAISLTAGVKTEIKTNITTIGFIHVRRTGTATDITVYKGNSPEGWEFDDTFLAFSAEGVSVISLMSDANTEAQVFLGGS